MSWRCEFQKWQNPEEPVLTVGERFSLKCRKWDTAKGEASSKKAPSGESLGSDSGNGEGLATTGPSWVSPDPLKLRILQARKTDDNTWELTATSVLVGDHKIEGLRYGDELAQAFQIQVKSVQDPQNPVAEPFGPMYIQWARPPGDLWLFLVLGLVVIILGSGWRTVVSLKQRRLWREFSSALRSEQSPWDEICESLFHLRRQLQEEAIATESPSSQTSAVHPLGGQLSRVFLRYLGRQEHQPLTSMSPRDIRKLLLRWQERPEGPWRQVYTFWEESERLKSQGKKEDLQFLLDWLGELSAELHRWYQKRSSHQGGQP
jgi:hypothetical protein